jgi:hypothetical protein
MEQGWRTPTASRTKQLEQQQAWKQLLSAAAQQAWDLLVLQAEGGQACVPHSACS